MTGGNLLLLNLNHIGDILFTTPAIRALRERFPEARITTVVMAGMEDVLRHNPCVDEVLTRQRGNLELLRLLPTVRARQCGISVLFSFSSVGLAVLGRLSGARTRIGFKEPGVSRFLNRPIIQNRAIHRVECYLDLARAAGADLSDPRTEMFVLDEERAFAADLLRSEGVTGDRPVVALSPGSTVPAKQWYPDSYATLGDRLAADGMDVLIVGSASERSTVDEVMRGAKSRLIDLSGRTRIGQLAAVFEKCSAAVSNDTGPLHLAVAVGTPVVAIFGPTNPNITGPYRAESVVFWERPDCSPCGYKPDCARDCMQAVTVERAYGAASRLASLRRDQR